MGADFIKIFCDPGNYSKDEIKLAVDEAHNKGKRISAHVLSEKEFQMCVECGVDSIEHGGPVSNNTLEMMKKKGIFWVATNTIFFHPQGLPRANYQINAPGTRRAKIEQTLVPKACEGIAKAFPKAISAKVDIALGSDSMHGLFPYEMEYMVEKGATPMEAIIAATRKGAELIGVEEQIGTLEVGKKADIISVPGNPLDDIRLTWDVNLIMKDGKRYDNLSSL